MCSLKKWKDYTLHLLQFHRKCLVIENLLLLAELFVGGEAGSIAEGLGLCMSMLSVVGQGQVRATMRAGRGLGEEEGWEGWESRKGLLGGGFVDAGLVEGGLVEGLSGWGLGGWGLGRNGLFNARFVCGFGAC